MAKTQQGSGLFLTVTQYLLTCFIILTILTDVVPWSPAFPAAGLDNSWSLAINEAYAKGLAFGKDIIFSFGPWSAIYTQNYHPATDLPCFLFSLYLAACYAVLSLLLSGRRMPLLLGLAALWGFGAARDYLMFLYPLLLSLACYRLTVPASHPRKIDAGKLAEPLLILLFLPLALMALVKVSGIYSGTLGALLCLALLWLNGRKCLVLVLLPLLPTATLLFWLWAGQLAGNLVYYLAGAQQIVSGYIQGMQIDNHLTLPVLLYLSASAMLLFLAVRSCQGALLARLLLLASFGLFLFLCFKQNFVRCEATHSGVVVPALLASCVMLYCMNDRALSPGWLIFPLLCALLLFSGQSRSPTVALADAGSRYVNAWHGLQTRVRRPDSLYANYQAGLEAIRNDYRVPALPGSSDIYSYGQAYLIASGNLWAPRPVFQSYSAYTPALQALNLNHLLGKDAPDNILFRLESIDGRYPPLDVGLEPAVMLRDYVVGSRDQRYIYLHRRAARGVALTMATLAEVTTAMGHQVALPTGDGPVFLQADIRQTLLGRLWTVLYKPSDAYINFFLADGNKTTFRLIPAMTSAGFLVSPMLKDTDDFYTLLTTQGAHGGHPAVTSVSIDIADSTLPIWEKTVTLRFVRVGG